MLCEEIQKFLKHLASLGGLMKNKVREKTLDKNEISNFNPISSFEDETDLVEIASITVDNCTDVGAVILRKNQDI